MKSSFMLYDIIISMYADTLTLRFIVITKINFFPCAKFNFSHFPFSRTQTQKIYIKKSCAITKIDNSSSQTQAEWMRWKIRKCNVTNTSKYIFLCKTKNITHNDWKLHFHSLTQWNDFSNTRTLVCVCWCACVNEENRCWNFHTNFSCAGAAFCTLWKTPKKSVERQKRDIKAKEEKNWRKKFTKNY
jgi:hypothetical protein